jgi:hypothetical protein
MKKQYFVLVSLIVLMVVLAGCQSGGGEKISSDEALDVSQKTLSELQGNKTDISFTGAISKGEEKEITFLMHDYKDAPKNPQTLKETQDALIPLEGRLDVRIVETGETQEIDVTHKAPQGKVLQYIIYEVRGREDNPKSNTIHPARMYETGWDPAPQMVRIVDGKDKYASSSYSRPLLKSKDYDAPLSGPEFEVEEWQPAAAVWAVEKDEKLTLAFKYIDMSGVPTYLEVK